MATQLNEKAWAILKYEEQTALSLKHGYKKSSWEAGEIIGKAHYKYLELEQRAKQFLTMFTEHFEMYDDIIPDWVKIDKRVKRYFFFTIEKRYTIRESIEKINDPEFKKSKSRTEIIIKALKKLADSESVAEKNLAILVFDFDRWNNYRILPRDIQEPSAFKRRNKKYDIRNIQNLLSMSPFSVEMIVKTFKVNHGNTKVLWMPIFSRHLSGDDSIIPIHQSVKTIGEVSKIGYFLFTRLERAKIFYKLVQEYDLETKGKSCVDGQRFWPEYRDAVKHAVNYNQIKKRIPSRKFLESALKDLDSNKLALSKDGYSRVRKYKRP